ncbi:MAG: UDP-N-acetylmuramate--L-alanine ligase [Acidobacteria bacterium]|nr:UDP-N-acetylmuramate--L-alanine ligase [Acidobacteriota bacterium]
MRSVHLVGIGGAGMSALARVLLARGADVSGSDIKDSRALEALRALGARVHVGHRATNLDGADCLVVSSAIRRDNPEMRAAREQGVPVLHRAQVLALLMRERRGIAVAGTHGKTTTTSMIALALQRGGLDPTFLVGGDVNEIGSNAHHGTGEWLVAEADESDGSFLWLAPEIAVVTNVDADHLDYYRNVGEIRESFVAFLQNVLEGGTAVLCADDPGARAVLARTEGRAVTYGLDDGEWRGRMASVGPLGSRVVVTHAGAEVGEMALSVPGAHNVRNALATVAVADLAGVPFAVAAGQLAVFQGVQRRFQVRGERAGVTVVDDYAHHPTEVRATLEAARERGFRRVIAIFQPHLYSRTAVLGRDIGAELAAADVVVVTDVYGAREDPTPGVTGKIVVDGLLEIAPRRKVAYLPTRGDIPGYVAACTEPGDLVLTVGAGDVTMLGGQILRAIGERGR